MKNIYYLEDKIEETYLFSRTHTKRKLFHIIKKSQFMNNNILNLIFSLKYIPFFHGKKNCYEILRMF